MRSRCRSCRRPSWCWPSRKTAASPHPQARRPKPRPNPRPSRQLQDQGFSGSSGSSNDNKAGTQGHRLRRNGGVGASEGGTPGAKGPGVERWVSWGTSGGADGVPTAQSAIGVRSDGPLTSGRRLLEQGPSVSSLLVTGSVECRSNPPPRSMDPASGEPRPRAIGVHTHCVQVHSD